MNRAGMISDKVKRKLLEGIEDTENKLRSQYLNLKSWAEFEEFRKKYPEFRKIPFDLEMKMKFNQLISPNATDKPIMVHEEVIDKSKPDPFGRGIN